MSRLSRSLTALAVVLAPALSQAGDVIFENPRFRAVLGDDAVWRSLVQKPGGKELCATKHQTPLANIRIGDHHFQANHATRHDDQLTVAFRGCDTRLVYVVDTADDWIVYRLLRIEGARPSHVTLVRLSAARREHVGSYLNAVWDGQSAVCLRAASLQTDGRPRVGSELVELTAFTQDEPGPQLEGAAAALVIASPEELPKILHRLAIAYDLPRNSANDRPAKELPIARDSYWFLSCGERDVDRVIDYCQRTGFRQVMLNSGAWCDSPGHYTFRTSNYPDGLDSLRRTVARLHEHGILVGMHCFASKVSKRDAYVTPVPDRRFWVDMTATLAADIGPEDTAIRTSSDLSQWPGSPVAKRKMWEGGVQKHQEVVIDDEIVQYARIGPEGRWDMFLDCRRGAWGTRAAPHEAETDGRHYAVDGCINGYIIDQETMLLDEATSRLAHVFNTCDFDMVYFDGGEDVDRRRFNYYASKFQATAMAKFRKRPIVHMGTVLTHNLWHSFTRSGTADTYFNTIRGRIIAGGTWEKLPTVRDHIDRSVQRLIRLKGDMLPAELGWFGIWPKGEGTEGLQLDEIEYLMAKSLAHNAPISLQTSFARMESHPLTPGILQIVNQYEKLRQAGTVPEETRRQLQELGRDIVLLRDPERGQNQTPQFVPVQPLSGVAGTQDLRCLVGTRGDDTVATVWHYQGREGKLHVGQASSLPRKLDACDITGAAIVTLGERGETTIPIGPTRTTLLLRNTDAATAKEILTNARLELRKPVTLWIQAEQFERCVGDMRRGTEIDVREQDAFGDVVLCTGPCRPAADKPNYVEYRVQIPRAGRWTLWARVRYPRGGDDSFGIVRPGEEVTLSGNQVLGNCGAAGTEWHWTGRGGGITTVPPGSPVAFRLEAGPFLLRIHSREGGGTAATNPRLDVLCLTEDPDYVPADADAKAGLAGGGQ